MHMLYLEQTGSTNEYASSRLKELSDRTVVYTYCQTAGRGRLDRSWVNLGSGNVFASIVLKPNGHGSESYPALTHCLCLSIAKAMEEFGAKAAIKWPNDVLVNGRKAAGVLAQAVTENDRLLGIILGFGVNLSASPEDIEKIKAPATALNLETGSAPDRDLFLNSVLQGFFILYPLFEQEGFAALREEYMKRAGFINSTVTVTSFGSTLTGRATGISELGELLLTDGDNKEHVLSIGDIS